MPFPATGDALVARTGGMKRHITQPPRQPGNQPVPSADFAELPSVLTSLEAANVLRVGVREVRALVDSGQLAGRRLGPRKVVRISRAAVLALLRVQSAG
jgi:excisionase family DNA binding protein